jgi:hypothetical protein
VEARDRRPVRPTPGDRGAWSHGPIARVRTRPGTVAPASDAPTSAPGTIARRPLPPLPPQRGAVHSPAPGPTRAAYGARTWPPARGGFGLPSLRRNVCPHFYLTGTRGAIPIQAPHLLKGLLRQPSNVSRCQLRGGVHLDEGFVNDVCLTPRFNQCVFYEDELTRE